MGARRRSNLLGNEQFSNAINFIKAYHHTNHKGEKISLIAMKIKRYEITFNS